MIRPPRLYHSRRAVDLSVSVLVSISKTTPAAMVGICASDVRIMKKNVPLWLLIVRKQTRQPQIFPLRNVPPRLISDSKNDAVFEDLLSAESRICAEIRQSTSVPSIAFKGSTFRSVALIVDLNCSSGTKTWDGSIDKSLQESGFGHCIEKFQSGLQYVV